MAAVVGAAIASAAVTALTVEAVTFAIIAKAFITTLVIGSLSKALAKKPAQPEFGGGGGGFRASGGGGASVFTAQARNLSVRQPIAPWKVWVGESRQGGVLTFAQLSADKKYFHLVVTYACHPCKQIQEFQFDDLLIQREDLDDDGNVLAGKFSQESHTTHSERVTLNTGGGFNTAYPISSVEAAHVVTNGVVGGSVLSYLESFSSNGGAFAAELRDQTIQLNYTETGARQLLRIKVSLGDEPYGTQPFPDLVAESDGNWTAAHRQDGHCKVYYRFGAESLDGGIPAFSVIGQGMTLTDPRTAVTGYCNNPALVLAAFFTDDEWGFDADLDDEIDADSLEAAANVCDERVLLSGQETAAFVANVNKQQLTFPGVARTPRTGDGVKLFTSAAMPSGLAADTVYYAIRKGSKAIAVASSVANAMAGTAVVFTDAGEGALTLMYYDEPRYTVNGGWHVSEQPGEIVERLLGAMGGGRAVQASDRWFIHAGAYEIPTVTLDEDDIAGPVRINPMPSREDSANGVKGVYIDADRNWQPSDFPALQSATYLAADGDEAIWAEMDFTGFITSPRTAQRLSKIELLRRRNGLTLTGTFSLKAYLAVTGRTLALNFTKYGFSGKVFEVVESGFAVIDGKEGEGPSLGVQLSLRECAAAIWDWTTDEEQAADLSPNTTLLDAFSTPAAPGIPALTEEIYETTGSAGVKVRGLVTWEASVGPLVAHEVLEWVPVTESNWRSQTANPGRASIDDLAAGWYLLRTYAVSGLGKRSENSAVATVYVVGLTAPPAAVQDFGITPIGGGVAELSWARHADLDVRIGGRIHLRFSPSVASPGWNDMVEIAEATGDSRKVQVPHLSGTYAARAIDSSGNESATWVYVTTTEPDLLGFNAVATLTAEPGWAGTKVNTVVADGALKLDGTTLIDDMTDLIDDWGVIDSLGGVAAEGTCTLSSYIDLGAVYTSRVTLALSTVSFDTGDTVDERLEPIDNWGLIDGPEISDTSCEVFVATTEDDPAGAPTWTDFQPFVIGDYKARAFKFKLRLRSGNTEHNIQATALTVTVDMPDREQGARNVASGAGTKSVAYTLSPVFKALPRLAITAQNMATGDYFQVTSEATTGFDITFRNAGGAAVDRNFHWNAKGY